MQSDPSTLSSPPAPAEDFRIRLRRVAVSPQEEYLLRPGQVMPISNDLAASILSRKGRVKISLKGIVVEREDMGGRHTFWHEDSILCNDLAAAKDRKIYYKINPLQPDIVHLLDEAGCYIESLPLKFRPEVLNTEQQEAEVRKQNRQINRVTKRLQDLHGKDTAERLADLQANSREMQRVVQTMPASAQVSPKEPQEVSTAGRQCARGAAAINEGRATRASAVAMGRSISLERGPLPPADDYPDDYTSAEDWSDSPRTPQQQPTPVEQW